MFFVGVTLGGLLLLAIFSMLAMARKQDEDQDRLEVELRRDNSFVPNFDQEASPENICISIDPDLERSNPAENRILLNR
jgi:hypothetical protein